MKHNSGWQISLCLPFVGGFSLNTQHHMFRKAEEKEMKLTMENGSEIVFFDDGGEKLKGSGDA